MVHDSDGSPTTAPLARLKERIELLTRLSAATMIRPGERLEFTRWQTMKCTLARVKVDWDWDKSRCYRNVEVTSIVAYKGNGQPILRGNRNFKTWRTAETPLPAGRRKRKD